MHSKESARDKIEELVEKYSNVRAKRDYSENDTITNFILPLLKAVGWQIHDVHEVKQEGYPRSFTRNLPVERRAIDKPDCVISLSGKPYMVLEFKSLGYGRNIDRYASQVEILLRKAEYVNAKYAVFTNFAETVVYDRTSERQLLEFRKPEQYLSRFEELWEYLSKEKAATKM